VIAGEDIAGAAHVGGELIDLIEAAIDGRAGEIQEPQVPDDEIVGLGIPEFGKLQIAAADPETFTLQAANQMTADEPAGPADQGRFLIGRGRKLSLLKNALNREPSCRSIIAA